MLIEGHKESDITEWQIDFFLIFSISDNGVTAHPFAQVENLGLF